TGHDRSRHVDGPSAQRATLLGEADLQTALVLGAAGALEQPVALQTLDQRRSAGGLERELVRQLMKRSWRTLPQCQHHQILRVGQSQRRENRPIDRDDVAGSRHHREAELILQQQKIVIRRHGSIIRTLTVSTLIIMPPSCGRLPRRARIRHAVGLYAGFNSRLITYAGPASVGPYESTLPPSAEQRAELACPLCGSPMT